MHRYFMLLPDITNNGTLFYHDIDDVYNRAEKAIERTVPCGVDLSDEDEHYEQVHDRLEQILSTVHIGASLSFPMLALLVGLVLDIVAKKMKFGSLRMPVTVFQFFIAFLFSLLLWATQSRDITTWVESNLVWSNEKVSAELVLTLLMPTLIFESAFKMPEQAYSSNFWVILFVAGGAYVTSLAVQGATMLFALYTENVTWDQMFLFASMIGATDPVAVVALLEEIGAPFRMRTIIEGESLLNDGVALFAFRIFRLLYMNALGLEAPFWQIPLWFVYVILSVIVGQGLAVLCMWSLKNALYGQPRQQQACIFLHVYAVWFICERVFEGSGVLSIVYFGLTMSKHKETLAHHTVEETLHIWEFLGYWANCIIFIMAGYHIGKAVGDDTKTGSHIDTFIAGILLYPLGVMARSLFMAFFYRVQIWAEGGAKITDFVCYTWGGLRGALPLLLSLQLYEIAEDAKIEYPNVFTHHLIELADKNLVLVSGTVIMSLLLQGITFEKLANKVGMKLKPYYVRKFNERLNFNLQRKIEDQVAELQGSSADYYAGVNWAKVHEILASLFQHGKTAKQKLQEARYHERCNMETDDEDENTIIEAKNRLVSYKRSGSVSKQSGTIRSEVPSNLTRLTLFSQYAPFGSAIESVNDDNVVNNLDTSWFPPEAKNNTEVTREDVQRAYLRIMKAKVMNYWREGMVSATTINNMINAFDWAIDQGKFNIYQFWNQFTTPDTLRSRCIGIFGTFCRKVTVWLKKIYLLDEKPRDHPQEQDMWLLVSLTLAFIHVYFSFNFSAHVIFTSHYEQNHKEFKKDEIFLESLLSFLFVLEGCVLMPYYITQSKRWQGDPKHLANNIRNKIVLSIMIISLCGYLMVSILAILAIWPPYSDPNETKCFQHNRWDNSITFCNTFGFILFVTPCALLIIKFFLTMPCFIYMLGEICGEMNRRRARIAFASLNTLVRLTDEADLKKDDFPDEKVLKLAKRYNKELRDAASTRLLDELRAHETSAEEILVVRTKQATRSILIELQKTAFEFVNKGLLAEDECQKTLDSIERTLARVEHLCYVPQPRLEQQLSAVAWMQNSYMKNVAKDTKQAMVDEILSRLERPPMQMRYEEEIPRDDMYFLANGIAIATYTGRKTKEELRITGTWINEHIAVAVIDDRPTQDRKVPVTKMISNGRLHRLKQDKLKELLAEFDEMREALRHHFVSFQIADVIAQHFENGRAWVNTYFDADMIKYVHEDATNVDVPLYKMLLLIHGIARVQNEDRNHIVRQMNATLEVIEGPANVRLWPHLGERTVIYMIVDVGELGTQTKKSFIHNERKSRRPTKYGNESSIVEMPRTGTNHLTPGASTDTNKKTPQKTDGNDDRPSEKTQGSTSEQQEEQLSNKTQESKETSERDDEIDMLKKKKKVKAKESKRTITKNQ